MIFITVGTHPQQFDRLLRAVDMLVESGGIREGVFAQTGHSTYKPKNYEFKKFLSLEEFNSAVRNASIIITHGGEGSIGAALQFEKPLVVVPRLKRFSEHTNDHQLELTRAVAEEGAGIAVYEISGLADAIASAQKLGKPKTQHARGIIKILEEFVEREHLARN